MFLSQEEKESNEACVQVFGVVTRELLAFLVTLLAIQGSELFALKILLILSSFVRMKTVRG